MNCIMVSLLRIIKQFEGGMKRKAQPRMNYDCGNDSASITVRNRRLTDRSHVTSPLFYVSCFPFLILPFAFSSNIIFVSLDMHVNLSTQMKLRSRYPDASVEEKEVGERERWGRQKLGLDFVAITLPFVCFLEAMNSLLVLQPIW